jgi:hypothetical protein
MKFCPSCQHDLPLESFSVRRASLDGYCHKCKSCSSKYCKQYREINLDSIKNQKKAYYTRQQETVKAKVKDYKATNKAKISEYSKKYHQRTYNIRKQELLGKKKALRAMGLNDTEKAWYRAWQKNREKNDLHFKLKRRIGSRIRAVLRKTIKTTKTVDLLGCSIAEFKEHIEKQWAVNMSWGNYGRRGWHIDHIIPCIAFDLTKQEEQIKCFHYTNLQPLWALENASKGDLLPNGTRGRSLRHVD